MDDLKNSIFSTPLLKVLSFLFDYPDKELSDQEIVKGIKGVKRSAVHQSLVRLANLGAVKRVSRGRSCFSTLDHNNVWIGYLKVAGNVMEISPLVNALKDRSSKIVLFGSRASGTNRGDSDFDLAVVSNDPASIRSIVAGSDLGDRVQLVVKTPLEMLGLESAEQVFASEIRKGVVLWER